MNQVLMGWDPMGIEWAVILKAAPCLLPDSLESFLNYS